MSERTIRATHEADGTIVVRSPSVGAVVGLPEVGDVVVGGRAIGVLETLSARETLIAPSTVSGRVVERMLGSATREYVGYGAPMLKLDPRIAGEATASVAKADTAAELVFRAPMSGRFYSRPSPAKPPLVEVGTLVESGQGVGLLEVMKTFHRVVYGGEGLPERARVVRVVPVDGDDVLRASVLLELEPA